MVDHSILMHVSSNVLLQEYEYQAKVARMEANDKKRIYNEMRDEACNNRPGGKIFCLRPFDTGY
jgi:hypothetical protein